MKALCSVSLQAQYHIADAAELPAATPETMDCCYILFQDTLPKQRLTNIALTAHSNPAHHANL
jgi:hypothetical protein